MTDKKPTRKGSPTIYVWVTPQEKYEIEVLAQTTGRSTSAYLRNIGLGYPVKSILDNKRVEELSRINGDMGRFGGLLKMWLTNDPRLLLKNPADEMKLILGVLQKIGQLQAEMGNVMRHVVLPEAVLEHVPGTNVMGPKRKSVSKTKKETAS